MAATQHWLLQWRFRRLWMASDTQKRAPVIEKPGADEAPTVQSLSREKPDRWAAEGALAGCPEKNQPYNPLSRTVRLTCAKPKYPHGESNPGFRAENPTSWATRRWGRSTFELLAAEPRVSSRRLWSEGLFLRENPCQLVHRRARGRSLIEPAMGRRIDAGGTIPPRSGLMAGSLRPTHPAAEGNSKRTRGGSAGR